MGEQGIITYWLYVAASKVWDLKRDSQDLVELFERFERLTEKPSIPILLTFTNIPKNDITFITCSVMSFDNFSLTLASLLPSVERPTRYSQAPVSTHWMQILCLQTALIQTSCQINSLMVVHTISGAMCQRSIILIHLTGRI